MELPADEEVAVRQHLCKARPTEGSCSCMGARENEPVCMCKMQWIETVNNAYYQIHEHRGAQGILITATKLPEHQQPK